MQSPDGAEEGFGSKSLGAESGANFQIPASLSDAIADHLGRDLAEGRLQPGERLVESQLCAQFGVSRTPMREAFRILAAEGLVELSARKGARVAELTEQVITDVFAVRMALEALCSRLAAERITAEQTEGLKQIDSDMREAVELGDARTFFLLNTRFHAAVAAASHNEYLSLVQQSAAARSFRPLFLSLSNVGHLRESVDGHAAILDALEKRDPELAARGAEEHIRGGEREALRLVRGFAPAPAQNAPSETAG